MKQLMIAIGVGGLILVAVVVLAVWGCSGKVSMTDPVNEVRPVSEDEKKAIIESLARHNKDLSKKDLERMRKSLGGKQKK